MKFRNTYITVIFMVIIAGTTRAQMCLEVTKHQKISDTQGNFSGILDNNDFFGQDVINIGDLNGDGIIDLAVGAMWDDDGGTDNGAIWILFLKADGTVDSYQKISETQGGFAGTLAVNDKFGTGIAPIGDLNSDGNIDLVVGAEGSDDGGTNRGSIWILFLNSNGTVQANQKISSTQGGFTGILDDNDRFGEKVAAIGDLNNDGTPDIVVSARRDDDGGSDKGAVWVLFLNNNGTVNSHQKISDTQGSFTGTLSTTDRWGVVASISDVNGDGVNDIAVGATLDDDGGLNSGATWILFLKTDGTVSGYQKISATQGNLLGPLNSLDRFGHSVSTIGDLDNDGTPDIIVNSWTDNDGGTERGAIWILFLNADGTVKTEFKISDTQGGFTGVLDDTDRFGTGLTCIGDFFGDSVADIACGARLDDDGGIDRGAVWILNLVDTCFVAPPGPPCGVNADFSADTVCLGDSISFIDLSTDSVSNIVNWHWNFGDGDSIDSIQNPYHIYDTSGSFSVQLVVLNDSTPACTDTISILVFVIPNPYALAGSDTVVCAFDSFLLGTSPSPNYVYSWSPSLGISDSSISNPSFSYGDTSNYVLTVIDTASGCLSNDSIEISVITEVTAIVGGDTAICAGDLAQLSAAGGVNYCWSPPQGLSDTGVANPYVNPDSNITYIVIVKAGSCPNDTDSVSIYVNPIPSVQVSADITINIGETVQLNGSGGPTYSWFPPISLNCSICENPIANPSQTTIYILTVTDSIGCTSADTIVVTVDNTKVIFIPTIFSPNGDGENDYFYVQGLGIEELDLMIFDRWGEKIFENTGFKANDQSIGWDGMFKGQPMNPAVFVYVVTGSFIDGTEISEKGDFTLIK